MEEFYTSFDYISGKLYHRFILGEDHVKEVVYNYPLDLYVKGSLPINQSRSLFGDALNKVSFAAFSEFSDFIRSNSKTQQIFGQTSIPYQFISKRYEKDIHFDMSKLKIMFIDIETGYGNWFVYDDNEEVRASKPGTLEITSMKLGEIRASEFPLQVMEQDDNGIYTWKPYSESCYSKFYNFGFPDPSKALYPITAVTCRTLHKKTVVFGIREISEAKIKKLGIDEYRYHATEKSLITDLINYISKEEPNIISGFNCKYFDIPYIINRSAIVCSATIQHRLSPFHHEKRGGCVFKKETKNEWGGEELTYSILGIEILDYKKLYSKFSVSTLENNKLDTIANYELGIGKVDYHALGYKSLSDLFHRNYELYIEYNVKDVMVLEELDNKLNFFLLTLTIAYLGKIKFDDVFGQMKFWDNYIYNVLKDRNIQIPPAEHQSKTQIAGGFVKESKPGLYDWVLTMDMTSLYPSIMMTLNMSPETIQQSNTALFNHGAAIDRMIDLDDSLFRVKANECIAANGSIYRTDKLGIIPELVSKLFDMRSESKTEMKAVSKLVESAKEQEEKQTLRKKMAMLNAKQLAFKIAANALYGSLASPYFRYSNPLIAEGITLTGQLIIKYAAKCINDLCNEKLGTHEKDYVLFSDTDSCAIHLDYLVKNFLPRGKEADKQFTVDMLDKFIKKHVDPVLDEKFATLAEYLNSKNNRLSMKRETIADKTLIRSKKHYVMRYYDVEGTRYQEPRLKMMGIETAKSSTPNIVRKSLEKCIRIILEQKQEDLQQYVREFRDEFFHAPVEDIAFPRGVNDLEKWASFPPGTPIHTRGSLIYNKFVREFSDLGLTPIQSGDKVKFVYMKEPNPWFTNSLAFPSELPEEFGVKDYIDRNTQFEKAFMSPLESFTTIVGWDPHKKTDLSSFFG